MTSGFVWQVNVTRYFWRCVADYCLASSASASGSSSNDVEVEAARCVTLTAYSHECTRVNNAGIAWRSQQLCRKFNTSAVRAAARYRGAGGTFRRVVQLNILTRNATRERG